MPRHNRTQIHQRYDPSPLAHSQPKRAFRTKRDAESAAREAMRYNLDLDLYAYQSPIDGKWYLSSVDQTNQ